jgi:preprotein translocase subunit SecD
MRLLCLLAGILGLTLLPVHAGHSPPKIIMRVNIQTTGAGMSSMEAVTINVPPDNEEILVRRLPEATEQDLIDVHADASGAVHFRFNHTGQINLDAVTAQNQGRILVVSLNGIIIYAPTIDEEISNGELIIPHPMNPEILLLLQEQAQKNVASAKRM